jgi:hypothetical protein
LPVQRIRLIQIKAAARLPPKKWRMSFYPRQVSIVEIAGIATIILSVAVVVGMLYSLLAAP